MTSITAPVVVVLKQDAPADDLDRVITVAGTLTSEACLVRGDTWSAIALGDGTRELELDALTTLDAVDRVVPVQAPFRLASREVFDSETVVRVETGIGANQLGFEIGGYAPLAIMAGRSASGDGEEGLLTAARSMRDAGVRIFHAGRFRSGNGTRNAAGSPLSGELTRAIADEVGLAVCIEVTDPRDVEAASAVADVLQVGSESMQDFNLLRAMGHATRPVIVRRGLGATIEEFLLAAEYVLSYGNGRVILCESGIRTFDVADRPRFEINAIAVIKRATHLPLIADPSRASSRGRLIPMVARAAIAAGADGLFIELHDDRSSGGSANGVPVSALGDLIAGVEPISRAIGRSASTRVVLADRPAAAPQAPEPLESYNAAVDLLGRNLVPGRADRTYLRAEDRDWSYQEIAEGADAAGAGLLDIGLERGDRLLLALRDCPEFVMTFWGAIKAGLTPVPIPHGLSPSELRFILNDSRARAVVSDEASAPSMLSVLEDGGAVGLVVGRVAEEPARSWEAVCGSAARLDPAATTEQEIAFWLYTSGTSGLPKAVMHRHGHLKVAEAGLARSVLHLEADDVVLSIPRMSFAYGLGNSVYLPAAVGASTSVMTGPVIPAGVQEVLQRAKPTVLFGVPVFYAGFIGLAKSRIPASVRIAISSAEALSSEVLFGFQDRFGLPLLDGFGSTEAMHHVASNLPDDVVPGSVGRPLPGYRVEVRDRDRQPLADGQIGELWIEGPTTFAGYWRRPELTHDVYQGTWMRTGDLARIVDGRVFHLGRIDAMIKLGGIWVSPFEIEDVLRSHDDVGDAAVIGVDDGSGVPYVQAFVTSGRTDAEFTHELMRLCRRRLAKSEVPRSFEVVDSLPPMRERVRRVSSREHLHDEPMIN